MPEFGTATPLKRRGKPVRLSEKLASPEHAAQPGRVKIRLSDLLREKKA